MSASALTWFCAVAVVLLLLAEVQARRAWRAPAKLAASSAFVAVALALGGVQSAYGRWIVAALLLGWLGDALLLSDRSGPFLGGLGAFLLSHLCFGAAFVVGGVALPAVAAAALVALAAGLLIWRWLGPHLQGAMRVAVAAYVWVILSMCCAAAGHAVAQQRWMALAGALLFAASDLAVARERFVAPGRVNRLWGLPTYFAAQLLLAWTVATPPGG
ncbi:MAG: lysoplasmalogenase [Rubrivivax sp.]